MPIEMLSAIDAVERIKSCTATGGRVLGVDGFQMVADGVIGRIDLILDLSSRSMTVEAAEAEAIAFVRANDAGDVMFEVVVGQPDDVL